MDGDRQVQFGRPKDDDDDDLEFRENINERLRHATVQAPTQVRQRTKFFSKLMATVAISVMQDALHEIIIMREINQIPQAHVDVDFVPLTEKYSAVEFNVERHVSTDKKFLAFRKFSRDLTWLEQVFNIVVTNLENDFYFDDLEKILADDALTREEETTLLASKEFNQRELGKLRLYMESERKDMTRMIQDLTERLGNVKDELNDNILENTIKIGYVTDWEKARHEQNKIVLDRNEKEYSGTAFDMNVEIDKENRVHDEMWMFLEGSLTEYQEDIEKWMEKYDRDMEEKEKEIQDMKIRTENLAEEHIALQAEYDRRQKEMDDFKAYKIQQKREAEELERRTNAATRIQSWWRGVMFRKGLGPFRRKKKKRGNDKKGSARGGSGRKNQK
ncbi:dynein regulatory complex protein 9-like isoform X2 [Zophobas morio]|uniref:dynein regulatory complex protein 9-like isoform X2 n=1 Tax=Zophobas morio TaxID=2755281 RepID=UPI003082CEAA